MQSFSKGINDSQDVTSRPFLFCEEMQVLVSNLSLKLLFDWSQWLDLARTALGEIQMRWAAF